MEWQKLEGTWKGGKQWSHLTTLWRRLQDLLFAIFAIIAWDSVANLTALAALANMGNGSARYVRSLRATFILDTASVLAADGITVVAALGGGNWIRQAQSDPYWSGQAAWYISAATGADENSGLLAAPIRTWAEFRRRVESTGVRAQMLVTILTDLPAGDPVSILTYRTADNYLAILGAATDEFADQVVTYTRDTGQIGPNNNDVGTLQGLVIAAADEGKLVRFTSGNWNGAELWLTVLLAANTLRVSQPMVGGNFDFPVPPVGAVAPGDTFMVQDLPRVTIGQLQVDAGSTVGLPLRISHLSATTVAGDHAVLAGTMVSVNECYFDDVQFDGTFAYLNNCAGQVWLMNTQVALQAGVYSYVVATGSTISASYNLFFQGGLPNIGFAYSNLDVSSIYVEDEWAIYDMDLDVTAWNTAIEVHGTLIGLNAGPTYAIVLTRASTYSTRLHSNRPTVTPDAFAFADGAVLTSAQLPYSAQRTGETFYNSNAGAAVRGLGGTTFHLSGVVTNPGAGAPVYLMPDGTESAVGAGPNMPDKAWIMSSTSQLRGLRVLSNVVPAADLTVRVYRIPAGTLVPAVTALQAVITAVGGSRQASADLAGSVAPVLESGDMLVASHNNADVLVTGLSITIET